MNNPLLSEFNTPFESAPFSTIKIDHYIPAIKKAIDVALQEIDAIANQEETPSFKNTLEQIEKCGKLIEEIVPYFSILTAQRLVTNYSRLLNKHHHF